MFTNLRRLFGYNTRILLGNSYWLLIIPVVASQLIIFWHMATASMVKASTVANSFELVIPLLAAFLCAHVVAPEHQNRVDELTFVRPVPFVRTIALRILSMYLIVAVLATMMLFVYKNGLKTQFDPLTTVLAGIPSVLFMSLLALAFASAWRSAAVGIGITLVYWAADATWGAALNPLFTLHGYSAALAATNGGPLTSSAWMVSKGVLLALTLVIGWFARTGLGRPAAPRRWRAVLRLAVGTVPLVVAYLVTGAYWQLSQARGAAEEQPHQARTIYRQAFAGFGAVPVPYLFGATFADYIGFPNQGGEDDLAIGSHRDAAVARLLATAQRHPESPWADHAFYEVIRLGEATAPASEADDKGKRMTSQYCRTFLGEYPASVFAPDVASRMVKLGILTGDEDGMMWAYTRALTAYRGTDGAAEAAAAMQGYFMSLGDIARATEAARASADAAPVTAKPEALLRLGGFLAQHGQPDEARVALTQVDAAVRAKLDATGLSTLDADHLDVDVMARRTAILRIRTDARAALIALDAAAEAPPAPAPTPVSPPAAH